MMKSNQKITINSLKFDGKIQRTWKADLIQTRDSLLIFAGVFENEISHPELGVIRRGTISYEYYWLDRWYNIFRFHEPEGDFRNYYCNLNMPPKFEKKVLDYIDMDIDVWVSKDFSYEILDLDEFITNSKKYSYSEDLQIKVFQTLDELVNLIKIKGFPFSQI